MTHFLEFYSFYYYQDSGNKNFEKLARIKIGAMTQGLYHIDLYMFVYDFTKEELDF